MAGSLSLLHHRLSCQGLVFNLIIKGLSKNFSFWTVSFFGIYARNVCRYV